MRLHIVKWMRNNSELEVPYLDNTTKIFRHRHGHKTKDEWNILCDQLSRDREW